MSSLATIPKTAPSPREIELLNRVVGPANSLQRAWLAGFLAGIEPVCWAGAAGSSATAAEPITIVYASESGNCEKLADDVARAARKIGLKPTLVDMADLETGRRANAKRLMVVAATWAKASRPRAPRGPTGN